MTLTALEKRFEMEFKKVLRKYVENHKSECSFQKSEKCKQRFERGVFTLHCCDWHVLLPVERLLQSFR